jgi:hypothetical protein
LHLDYHVCPASQALAEKVRIVEETYEPGSTVSLVAAVMGLRRTSSFSLGEGLPPRAR